LSPPVEDGGHPVAVDAIIVPSARPSEYLRPLMRLAAELQCQLLFLSSGYASPRRADELAAEAGVDAVTIDVRGLPSGILPRFETTGVLAGTPFALKTDTSFKRNLGLMVARASGWRRIAFLDDDVQIRSFRDLQFAARQLDRYDAAGMRNIGFPDDSVVCHAFRMAAGRQENFINAGAFMVAPDRARSFFPSIYHDAWMYLLDDVRIRPTTLAGEFIGKVRDPFDDPRRARAEQFGDTIAEGIFWLLDNGGRVRDADHAFWAEVLHRRRNFINTVLRRVGGLSLERDHANRVIGALKAAQGRCSLIDADLCVRYIRAWKADRGRWRRFLDRLPEEVGIDEALRALRLSGQVTSDPAGDGVKEGIPP
jgi:hypothetical protein